MIHFVATHESEIDRSGFGRFDSTASVHEDLVLHLLNFPVSSRSTAIPSSALARFYDDWGQRWF
jgi:hypothetical protein